MLNIKLNLNLTFYIFVILCCCGLLFIFLFLNLSQNAPRSLVPSKAISTREEFEKQFVTDNSLVTSSDKLIMVLDEKDSSQYLIVHQHNRAEGVVHYSLLIDYKSPQYGEYQLQDLEFGDVFNYPYLSKSFLSVIDCKKRTISRLMDAYFAKNMGRNQIKTGPGMHYGTMTITSERPDLEKIELKLCTV